MEPTVSDDVISRIEFNDESGGAGQFVKWKVCDGTPVDPGSILLEYRITTADGAQSNNRKLRSSVAGIVERKIVCKPNDSLAIGQLIALVKQCRHDVCVKDLCAGCGKDLRVKDGAPGERIESSLANVAMLHHVPELVISTELARQQGKLDQQQIIDQRKLVLLVDLDQTLVHTTNEVVSNNLEDVFHYQLLPNPIWYHTRLRPHTKQFLQSMKCLYEMHIFTFGQRLYAHTIAAMLDPKKELFGQRILSRDECFDAQLKTANLKALFPCGDQLTVIIDDREDVWQHAPNMINVKPYRYFKQTGDINAPSKSSKLDHTDRTQSSLSKSDHPDRVPPPSDANNQPDDDHDDYLIHAEDILQRVHRAFYELYDRDRTRLPDLKSVIPYVKGKVLRGVHIVFSGLIANNQSAESTPIYRAALAFGATVHPDVDRHSTTHVIAARWGTHKVHMAARYATGIHIVTPQWLWECVERWERVDEKLFALERQTIVSMPVEKCTTAKTQIAVNECVSHGGESTTLSKIAIRSMTDEVDEALSSSDDDDKQKVDDGKRSADEDDDDEVEYKKSRLADDDESSDDQNNNDDDDDDDDEMAAALERQMSE